jgi:hypothetical protein
MLLSFIQMEGAPCIPLSGCRDATPLRVTQRHFWVLTHLAGREYAHGFRVSLE